MVISFSLFNVFLFLVHFLPNFMFWSFFKREVAYALWLPKKSLLPLLGMLYGDSKHPCHPLKKGWACSMVTQNIPLTPVGHALW